MSLIHTHCCADHRRIERLDLLIEQGANAIRDALSQLGSAIDNLRGTPLFDKAVGLLNDVDVGSLLKFKDAWDRKITAQFNGPNAVKDLQSLLDRLGVVSGELRPQHQTANLNLDLSTPLAKESRAIGFDQDFGLIGGITTASLAEVQADARVVFTLGIDLNGDIGSNFTLTPSTLLTALNAQTVPPQPTNVRQIAARPMGLADRPGLEDRARFTLSDGTTFDVDFDGLTTVGQALSAINAQASAALGIRLCPALFGGASFASLDLTRKSFVLTDKTKGTTGRFLSVH